MSREALLKLLRRCIDWWAPITTELSSGGGAAVTAAARCSVCFRDFWWRSSDFEPGTRTTHVHLWTSAAILFSGSQITRVLRIFEFMDVNVVSRGTYHRHQSTYLHQAIRHVWERKQRAELQRLRECERVVLGGDGRCSQVGHSAMHCTYSMQDCSTGKIVHVEQVHVSNTIIIIFTMKLHFCIDTPLMLVED